MLDGVTRGAHIQKCNRVRTNVCIIGMATSSLRRATGAALKVIAATPQRASSGVPRLEPANPRSCSMKCAG